MFAGKSGRKLSRNGRQYNFKNAKRSSSNKKSKKNSNDKNKNTEIVKKI